MNNESIAQLVNQQTNVLHYQVMTRLPIQLQNLLINRRINQLRIYKLT